MAKYDSGKKFIVSELPTEICVDANCESIDKLLDIHKADVSPIEWYKSPGQGLRLLETVVCGYSGQSTYADVDVLSEEGSRRPPRQILSERVLLVGTKALCQLRLFGWRRFNAVWHDEYLGFTTGHIRIDATGNGKSIKGIALFHCAEMCEELFDILESAFRSLGEADIRFVIVNSRESLKNCSFSPRADELVITADIHDEECGVFDDQGQVSGGPGSVASGQSNPQGGSSSRGYGSDD